MDYAGYIRTHSSRVNGSYLFNGILTDSERRKFLRPPSVTIFFAVIFAALKTAISAFTNKFCRMFIRIKALTVKRQRFQLKSFGFSRRKMGKKYKPWYTTMIKRSVTNFDHPDITNVRSRNARRKRAYASKLNCHEVKNILNL